jgi:hypothetical protein
MGLGIWLQSQDPEARRQTLERRERGERSEFKTNARRDALHHPTMVATKTLIAEITAEAMAEEWIDEVRGELPAAVRARLDAKLQTRQQRNNPYADAYMPAGYVNGRSHFGEAREKRSADGSRGRFAPHLNARRIPIRRV